MLMNKFLLSAISFLAISTAAHAGNVKVVNQNDKPLDLRFEAADDDKNFKEFKNIPAFGEKFDAIKVTKEEFKGKELLAVKATVNGLTYNKSESCSKLNVDKHYKLVFTNDKINTTCEATELSVKEWEELMAADLAPVEVAKP